MPTDREEFLERIKKLPPDLTDAIFSEDIAETLLSIGKKYNLLLDKVGSLSEATNDVILGVLHPKEFISTLEKDLGVDRVTAQKIAQEVNTEIFAKIRESLRKVHKTEEPISASKPIVSESAPVKPPTPPSPPVFATEKKISFADLKPTPQAAGSSQLASGNNKPVASSQQPEAIIRPFQGGGVKAEVKKEPTANSQQPTVDGDLEKEVESLLRIAQQPKPKDETKKFWSTPETKPPVADIKLDEKPKPMVEVKIKAVEDEAVLPKMSPFGAKMQDGVFRSGPAEERKVVDEKLTVPKYGFSDPYREAPDEKERDGLPRAS